MLKKRRKRKKEKKRKGRKRVGGERMKKKKGGGGEIKRKKERFFKNIFKKNSNLPVYIKLRMLSKVVTSMLRSVRTPSGLSRMPVLKVASKWGDMAASTARWHRKRLLPTRIVASAKWPVFHKYLMPSARVSKYFWCQLILASSVLPAS